MADVTVIVFIVGCTLVGLHSRGLPVSMHHLQPTENLLWNCAILQALSITLPIVVWIFGLGPREAMTVRARQGCCGRVSVCVGA